MTEPRFSHPLARPIKVGVVACMLLGLLVVARIWTGCDGGSPAGPTQGTGSLSVSLLWPTARPAGALYDTLSVTVSGGGMDPIARDFPIAPEAKEVSWQIADVPVGDRTVAIVVVGRTTPGGPRQRLYEGSVSVTVAEGRTAAAAVPVQPVALDIRAGTLALSTAVLSLGDTLVARVVDASTSHTVPVYRWEWGDGSSTNWNRSSSAGHAYLDVGQYEVTVSVGDSISPSLVPQTLNATVTVHRRNQPPVARAGQDQWVAMGAEVHLDGSGSSDPDSDNLAYQWVQLSGPPANLLVPSSPSPVFVAASQGVYQFALTVRDSTLASLPDTIKVSVLAFAAVVPDTVSARLAVGRIGLDGSASYPHDGMLVYHWRQVRSETEVRPEYRALLARFVGTSVLGTLSDNDSDAADRVSFEPVEGRGLYVFTLAVESRQTATWSRPDTVHVLVRSEPPSVSVDASAEAVAGDTVTLKATATDDLGELAYRWRGSAVAQLSDTTMATPVFVPVTAGEYRFSVVAVDGDPQESEPREVTISVTARPLPTNHPPIADAGPDQNSHVGTTVILDGSRSSDPDTGDVLTYRWIAPAGVTLNDATAAQPIFTAGPLGVYQFVLVVSDGHQDSSPDTVVVAVANRPPQANAGLDQSVQVGEQVVLDGSGSGDPDGDALTYRWTAPAGVALSSTTAAQPTFTPNTAGTYRFTLVVNDGHQDSALDTVAIMATQSIVPPVPPDTTVELPGGTTMDFVKIGPGIFTMGSPDSEPGRSENEGPQHEVTISRGFYLGQYEVTQGQWQAVMGSTPWEGRALSSPRSPAVFISWNDTQLLVHALNQAAGDSVYRLPTEAEWEYACRAGSSTPWSFGDAEAQLGEYAWYSVNSLSIGEAYAHPVGTRLPNPWGLYDMHGNALEWVQDGCGTYAASSQLDPQGDLTSSAVVFRGGGFYYDASYARSAFRHCTGRNGGSEGSGVRLVRMATPVRANTRPKADAGPDQTVHAGASVTLDGSGSSAHDAASVTYLWTALAGVTLSDATAARPTFTVGEPGVYQFVLVINDGHQDSEPDTVVVTVTNHAPTANAGPDQTVNVGETVSLDGTASSDPDGDALTYRWTAPDGITLSDSTAARPRFTAAMPRVYSITLVVRDGLVDSAPDVVNVTVAEPTPSRDILVVDLPGGATMDFVWIDPGTFMMGASDTDTMAEDSERPQHQVTITRGFYLGKYELTQGQWKAVMGTEPWGHYLVLREPGNPAVQISWGDVQSLVHRLNEAAGDSLYRLPTEAEWEYACRAGTTTPWSFGDDPSRYGDYAWNYENATALNEEYGHPVGTKLPNPWGLYDMYGNVIEWCQDWFEAYPSSAQVDPQGASSGTGRVRRGAQFNDRYSNGRSSWRNSSSPAGRGHNVGARLVRLADPVPANYAPRAEAGPDQTWDVGTTVQLDGSGSRDADGDALTYHWAAPAGVTLSSTTTAQPSFTPSTSGTYQFALVVSDGYADSAPDTVVITVSEPPMQRPIELTMDLPGGATMKFVWIEPGTFMMGSPPAEVGRADDEGPQHQVTLTEGFYLASCEITQGQWVAGSGSRPWLGRYKAQDDPMLPAVYVSWQDVQRYIHLLNQASGDSTYRLPTEAEWEYACRAGGVTAWSFGDGVATLPEYAWYQDNTTLAGLSGYTQPVGTKRANRWGLYDMHGNAWEWVQDVYGLYGAAPEVDPVGATYHGSGEALSIRGGGGNATASSARSASRYSSQATFSDYWLGARLVRRAVPTSLQPANRPPIANAGQDQMVNVGTTVQFDGSGSSDPDGDALSYLWAVPAGVSLLGVATARPSFTPPSVGTYRVTLVVNDGKADSAPDTVTVTVVQLPALRETRVDGLPGGAEMQFVWLDPGVFIMGSPTSDPLAYDEERPQHQVAITKGFYLGIYEITQGQWRTVMGTAPWSGQWGVRDSPSHPAVDVSWDDLQIFVHTLNQAAGDSLYRLPTEAEWEYACRAGTTTRWSFGDDESQLGEYAWYGANAANAGLPYAQPVGTKQANPWGLYDMHGNVYEWVQDWYGQYTSGAQTDPAGPSAGTGRVFRGGSFQYGAKYPRSADRGYDAPGARGSSIGARLLRMASPEKLNHPPSANAGPDQTVNVGTMVQLDGTGSSDLDPSDVLSYAWTAPPGIALSGATTSRPTFIASIAGTYEFTLVVNDEQVRSAPDEVLITVTAPSPSDLVVPLPGGVTMAFMWIPPGSFYMGSPDTEPGRADDGREGPQHQVAITRGYYLGRYEVTQGQWEAVMGTTPWVRSWDVQVNPSCPAVGISWNDAQAFVHQLNETTGDSLYRLPTEAEWEYACRAGTTTAWSFGDDEGQLQSYAWIRANVQPVGTKLPNSWGLYDMHGNVWEWVQDWYASYSAEVQADPAGPATGSDRGMRGGGTDNVGIYTRSAFRQKAEPGFSYPTLGVRLLRTTAPVLPGHPPTSNAGPDQAVNVGATVQLDGTGSSDPNPGDQLTYAWTVPFGVTLSSVTAPRPSFAAVMAGTYRFTLVVNDGHVDSAPDTVQVTVTDSAGSPSGMVWVAAGSFLYGDSMTPVYLDAFWIDQYEVTNAQWNAYATATGRSPKSEPDDHPVASVTAFDAADYCSWAGKELPTQQQWEKAARGTDGRMYPWGEMIDESRANYGYSAGGTTPVGSYPTGVSPYGAYDMAGNVWEWTATEAGSGQVLRGGGWSSMADDVRCAYWRSTARNASHAASGFRCARGE